MKLIPKLLIIYTEKLTPVPETVVDYFLPFLIPGTTELRSDNHDRSFHPNLELCINRSELTLFARRFSPYVSSFVLPVSSFIYTLENSQPFSQMGKFLGQRISTRNGSSLGKPLQSRELLLDSRMSCVP